MSDTPSRRSRRSLLGNTGTPAPTRRHHAPVVEQPNIQAVIPDGSEPAEPAFLRATTTEEQARPTLMPDPGDLHDDDTALSPVDLPAESEGAAAPPAAWIVGGAVATALVLIVGMLAGVSFTGLGVALFGDDAAEELEEAPPLPVAAPTPPADEPAAEAAADEGEGTDDAVEAAPVDGDDAAAEPVEGDTDAAPTDEQVADPSSSDDKGVKIKLPKIKFGKRSSSGG